jgi:hypothetical protein
MTKPVPGAKRGRLPIVRGKGRRKTPLRQHQDRYSIGIFDVMVSMFEGERTGASVMVAAERKSRRSSIISKSLRYPLPTKIRAEFNQVADRVRTMAHWYTKDADDLKWRKAISKAIEYALAAACAGKQWRECHPLVGQVIVSLAATVGEAAWARRVLLPLMEREPSSDLVERNEKLAIFLDDIPIKIGDRDERILQIVSDFWTLKAQL